MDDVKENPMDVRASFLHDDDASYQSAFASAKVFARLRLLSIAPQSDGE